MRGGQGDAPLGLPSPLGERGGTFITSSKLKIRPATGFLQSKKKYLLIPRFNEKIKPAMHKNYSKIQQGINIPLF
jgi:hypothetical protein